MLFSAFTFAAFVSACGPRVTAWLADKSLDFGPAGRQLVRERYAVVVIEATNGRTGALETLESLSCMVDADTSDADVAAAFADLGLLDA